MDIEFKKNKDRYILNIYQSKPNQSLLIIGGILNNLDIKFIGKVKGFDKEELIEQRFNNRGLTGCLNIYGSKLNNGSITVENGQWG